MKDISGQTIAAKDAKQWLLENATSFEEAVKYVEDFPASFPQTSVVYTPDGGASISINEGGFTSSQFGSVHFNIAVQEALNEPKEESIPEKCKFYFLQANGEWLATVNEPSVLVESETKKEWTVKEPTSDDVVIAKAGFIPASVDITATLHRVAMHDDTVRSFQVWKFGEKATIDKVNAKNPVIAATEYAKVLDETDYSTFDIAYKAEVPTIIVQSPQDGRREVVVQGEWVQVEGGNYEPSYSGQLVSISAS